MAAVQSSEWLYFPEKTDLFTTLKTEIGDHIGCYLEEKGIFEIIADAFYRVAGSESVMRSRFDLCLDGVEIAEEPSLAAPTSRDLLFSALKACAKDERVVKIDQFKSFASWEVEDKIDCPSKENLTWYIKTQNSHTKRPSESMVYQDDPEGEMFGHYVKKPVPGGDYQLSDELLEKISNQFANRNNIGEFTIKRELRSLEISDEENISILTRAIIDCSRDQRCKRKREERTFTEEEQQLIDERVQRLTNCWKAKQKAQKEEQ